MKNRALHKKGEVNRFVKHESIDSYYYNGDV